MDMESSRRSALDRGGLKKPRLAADADSGDADRLFSRDPRLGAGSSSSTSQPRTRRAERERDEKEDAARPSLSYQELMHQYKTAIAELTFNSKPIITNLTIIAGENQHAAKGIASIICANILEVPSEQKLPSLYLLDSIVKNIGKDYVKYFAARLPKVFCEAYKQVDSSIHPGMRHLFGTWKGVFPSTPLQIIEKELGFSPIINGSSGATASKPESQITQPSSHSIHVNPKYLEARQRLQQSSKAKDTNSDGSSDLDTTADEAGRYDRTASIASTRQWTEPPAKMPSIQRPRKEQLNDSIPDKKGYRDIRDNDFSPELPRQSSDLLVGRVNEKIKERDGVDKPYYVAGGSASDTAANKRIDSDVDRAYGTYRPSVSAPTDRQLSPLNMNDTNKSSRLTPTNWKNSEEYIWDDMNLRLTDYGGANSTTKGGWNSDDVNKTSSLQRGKWMPEHLESQWNRSDTFSRYRIRPGGEERLPLFRDSEEHLPRPHVKQEPDSRMHIETTADPFSLGRAASGQHASFEWPPREPPSSVVSLNHMNSRTPGPSESHLIPRSSGFSASSLPMPGPHIIPSGGGPLSGPIGMFGRQRQQPLQPPSPSAQLPPLYMPLPHQRLHNSNDHEHLRSSSFSQKGQKPMPPPGQLNQASQAPVMRDSFPNLPQSRLQQPHTSVNPSEQMPTPSEQMPTPFASSLSQMRHHVPFTQPSQPDLAPHTTAQFHPSIQTEKPPLSLGTHQKPGFSGTSISSNPVSGQSSTSSLLAAIMKSGILSNHPSNSFQSPSVQPPLPTGPPPIQVLISSPSVTPSLSFPTSHGKAPTLMQPQVRAVLPPLPPGPPPASSLLATTSQVSNKDIADVTPLSNLLTSLVAKGTGPPPASSLVATTSQVSTTDIAALTPLSNLLTSLVAKGIISSPPTELPAVTSADMPIQGTGFTSSGMMPVPSASEILTSHPSSSKELVISEPSAPTIKVESDNLIGLDFKPEIIREFHPSVINALFDELRHRCNVCGLGFRLEKQLHNHLDLHASKSETNSLERVSRKWFADKSNWVAGNMEPSCRPVAAVCQEEVVLGSDKCKEPMVPADESQSICALCGEPFEDFYSDERDEWMYKGTVYLNSVPRQNDIISRDESMGPGLIVHSKCESNSVEEVEVAEYNRMDWTDS